MPLETICVPNCQSLPEVVFNVCAPPETYAGQVTNIYLTSVGHFLLDENDANEWGDRISLHQSEPSKIIVLSGIGNKPEAEPNAYNGAYGKLHIANKAHSIPFVIREIPNVNYNMMKSFEVIKKATAWYKTYSGKIYGGKGIEVSISFNQIIPEQHTDLESLSGLISWNYYLHPERNTSVI